MLLLFGLCNSFLFASLLFFNSQRKFWAHKSLSLHISQQCTNSDTVYRPLPLLQGLSECSLQAHIHSRHRLVPHTWHFSLWYSIHGLFFLSLVWRKWPSSLLQYLLSLSASGPTSVALIHSDEFDSFFLCLALSFSMGLLLSFFMVRITFILETNYQDHCINFHCSCIIYSISVASLCRLPTYRR